MLIGVSQQWLNDVACVEGTQAPEARGGYRANAWIFVSHAVGEGCDAIGTSKFS
jgi:hypothetical protein